MYTVKVINTFINLPYMCVYLTGMMRMIKTNLKVYNTGLTIVTRLYIRSHYQLFYPLSYRTFRSMVLKKAAQQLGNSLISEIRDDLY